MPRDGSHIYTVPDGTDGVPDQPVYSTPYNSFVHDVEQDLNAPRPILAGGTGAINERDAMIALKGEIAKQFVDNFDSYPFVNGSWYSEGGATSAPLPTSAFTGIYYEHLNTAYATIEAREISVPGRNYIRQKIAGVWQAWVLQVGPVSDLDGGLALKVAKAGDTMSGPLTISYAGTPASGGVIFGNTNHYLYLDGQTNPAAPAFTFNAPLNVGGTLTGVGIVSSTNVIASSNLYTGFAGPKGGTVYFGTDGAQYIQHNGAARFNAPGEMDHGANAIFASQFIASSGIVRFAREGAGEISSGKYLYFDGTSYALSGGALNVAQLNTPYLNMPYPATVQINQLAGSLFQEGPGSVVIASHSSAGYDPFISYHRAGGGYATNVGLMNTNRFGWGGWSAGVNNQYMFWSSADFSNPLIQTRLVYIGDVDHGYNSALNEPQAGAVCTGLSGPSGFNAFTGRYRALQVRTGTGYYATETG